MAIKRGFHKKTQFTPDKKCEENPRAIPISQVKRVKRETAPTSDSAQFILAWRSEDRAQIAAKAKPSQAMTAALFQEQPKVGGSKSPEQGKCLLMNEKKAKGP